MNVGEVISESNSPEISQFSFLLPKVDLDCTKSLYLFSADLFKTVDLFMFTCHLAGRMDEQALIASNALIDTAENEEEKLKYQKTIENKGIGTLKQLTKYSMLNSRHLVTNAVDLYLWFLSNIIQEVMKVQPNLLRSGESIKLDELLEFNDRQELIDYLIDRKVNELSYGGLKKVEQFMEDRLGITMFPDEQSRALLVLFIELRNIHVHNRGYVNRIFLSRVGTVNGFNFVLGKRHHVGFDEFGMFAENCVKSARFLDEQIAKKFDVKIKSYIDWRNELSSKPQVP